MRSNRALLTEGTVNPPVSSSCAFRITFITASAYMSLVGLATHCRIREREGGGELEEKERREERRRRYRFFIYQFFIVIITTTITATITSLPHHTTSTSIYNFKPPSPSPHTHLNHHYGRLLYHRHHIKHPQRLVLRTI